MKLCFKCGIYKRGLLHDLSKYGLTEFCSSARYFQGDRSPIEAEKLDKGYSLAWQHHKGHNPHHWEYWLDSINGEIKALRIPREYVIEMICDWVGASIVYSKNNPNYDEPYDEPWVYYQSHRKERIFHPNTSMELVYYLGVISELGINEFCELVRIELRGVYK